MVEVVLITGRTVGQGESIEKKLSDEYMEEAAVCELSKDDMNTLGIKDGDRIKIISNDEKVVVYARSSNLSKGIAFIPMGPWANALIPEGTDSTGMPSFKGLKVRIEKTEERVPSAEEVMEVSG
ncbi:MAG TPA: tRNA CCA-pyrophosphorylase [Archaeoglobaceae archaeon]|nr:tRNA CCA-pyrophosphorylase [Archaeoglobaceae archaeon]